MQDCECDAHDHNQRLSGFDVNGVGCTFARHHMICRYTRIETQIQRYIEMPFPLQIGINIDTEARFIDANIDKDLPLFLCSRSVRLNCHTQISRFIRLNDG